MITPSAGFAGLHDLAGSADPEADCDRHLRRVGLGLGDRRPLDGQVAALAGRPGSETA